MSLLMVLGLAFAAGAQEFEVAISGDDGFPCGIGTPFTFDAAFFLFPPPPRPDVPQREAAEFLDIRMIARASGGGRVFGMTRAGAIVVLSQDGTSTPFFAGIPGAFGNAIAVAQSGRVFMTTSVGLAVISPGGALEAVHPASSTLPVLAVAADGCTVYYATQTAIRRINGCTGAVLPDFVTLGDVHDVEPQPNGDVLVAAADSVLLYSAAGVLLRTVTSLGSVEGRRIEVWQAAMVNGMVWIAAGDGCSGVQLLRVESGTGREVGPRIPDLGLQRLTGLLPGAAAAVPIPTAAETTLILFAFTLAAGGALALRLR